MYACNTCGKDNLKKEKIKKLKKSLQLDSISGNISFVRWLVGQAAKTPPSHGGNRGSIPLRAVATN